MYRKGGEQAINPEQRGGEDESPEEEAAEEEAGDATDGPDRNRRPALARISKTTCNMDPLTLEPDGRFSLVLHRPQPHQHIWDELERQLGPGARRPPSVLELLFLNLNLCSQVSRSSGLRVQTVVPSVVKS